MNEAYIRERASYQLDLGFAQRNGRSVLQAANIRLDPADVERPPGFNRRVAALGDLVTARNAAKHGRPPESPVPEFVQSVRRVEQTDADNPGALAVTLDVTSMSINPDIRDGQVVDVCDSVVDFLCPPTVMNPPSSPFLPES